MVPELVPWTGRVGFYFDFFGPEHLLPLNSLLTFLLFCLILFHSWPNPSLPHCPAVGSGVTLAGSQSEWSTAVTMGDLRQELEQDPQQPRLWTG